MPSRCRFPPRPPQPDCSWAERRQQGAIFTLITALNRGLFGYNPSEALRTDTRCRPVGDLRATGDLCQGSFSVSRQAPWHLWGPGSPSTRPASWASEVETQEVCQPLGVMSFLQPCSYSACMVLVFFFFIFFYLKDALAPLLLSLTTVVWLKNDAGEKSRAALSCDLKIGKPTPLN